MKKLINHRKQEKELAQNLELAAMNKKQEVPSAPPDEFSKIIQEMAQRQISPKIREELQKKKKMPGKTPENDS